MASIYSSSDFGTKTGQGQKPLLVPASDMLELANAIQHRMATDPLLISLGMKLADSNCFKTYTIVSLCLESCCRELSKRAFDGEDEFDVMNVILMTRSTRVGSGEKSGNLDPVFKPGPRAIRILDGEEFFSEGESIIPLDDEGKPDVKSEEYSTALAIQARCCKELLAYDIALKAHDFTVWALTATYLKCTIQELIERATNSKSGVAEFVLYEMLDVTVISGKDGLKLVFHPGAMAKKVIKSDLSTESD